MTDTVKDEIERARRNLNLTQFHKLPDSEAQTIFNAAESHFVSTKGRRWWWEDFRHPAMKVQFPNQNGFEYLNRIVPSESEILWFIAEEDSLEFYPVYEANIREIQSIIGECYCFEYYIIPKDFRWLVCETHHDVVYAVGAEVEGRLRDIEI